MTLEALNQLQPDALRELLGRCNGAQAWIEGMVAAFPVQDKTRLLALAEECWYRCGPEDWLEAFAHHPRIGDLQGLREKFASTRAWASGEQSGANAASEEVLTALAAGNKAYEEKFGYIFIVCATGKSAPEMLDMLRIRLSNDPADELLIAMGEQDKITRIRLEKLLS